MVINNQDDFWLIDIAIVIIKADGKYHIEIIRSSFPQDILQLYNNNIEVFKQICEVALFLRVTEQVGKVAKWQGG